CEPGVHPRYRDGDAAYSDLLLAVVDRVTVLQRGGQRLDELVRVGDGVLGVAGHAGTAQQLAYLVFRQSCEYGLADSGAVWKHPPTDFGEHPHRVSRRHLRDVDDLVPVEHREIRRLLDLGDQPGQMPAGDGAEHGGGAVGEQQQARTQRVLAGGLLTDVSEVDKGADQPVDGG